MNVTRQLRPSLAQRAEEARSEIKRAERLLRTIETNKPLRWGHEKFSLLLFARAIKASKAALLLANSGYAEESRAVLRTINELLQHIAFVNIDHRTRDRKIKIFLEIETVEEKYDDAELLHRQKMLTTAKLRSTRSEINRQRHRHTTSTEFEDPTLRFKKMGWKQRNEIVLAFLESLEGCGVNKTHNDLIDHFLRVVGNRHVHVGPESLRSVWGNTRNPLGYKQVRLTPSPSRKGIKESYLLIGVMMLYLSYIIAMMYFTDDHPVVTRIRKHLKSRGVEVEARTRKQEDINTRGGIRPE